MGPAEPGSACGMAGCRQHPCTPAASSCQGPLQLSLTLRELRLEGGESRKEPTSVCVEAIQHFFADISQAAAAMPLVGRQSYLGNAGLRTMRTAGEEVGFNLTGHVYSSPLTFGLSEMCNESPSWEEGAVGASPSPQLLLGRPQSRCSAAPGRSSLPRRRPGAGISHAIKNQADAKPRKYPALMCKLAKRDLGAEQRRRGQRGR